MSRGNQRFNDLHSDVHRHVEKPVNLSKSRRARFLCDSQVFLLFRIEPASLGFNSVGLGIGNASQLRNPVNRAQCRVAASLLDSRDFFAFRRRPASLGSPAGFTGAWCFCSAGAIGSEKCLKMAIFRTFSSRNFAVSDNFRVFSCRAKLLALRAVVPRYSCQLPAVGLGKRRRVRREDLELYYSSCSKD